MESGDGSNFSFYMPKGGLVKLKNLCTFNVWPIFDKYLSPAYHHDRCERSVQMKLYTMHKRESVVIFMGFLVALGLVIFIGLVGPPITSTYERQASKMNISDISTGPFGIASPQLTTYHQQVWLFCKIQTEKKDDEAFEKSFSMSLDLFGISQGRVLKLFENVKNEETRRLNCPNNAGEFCQPITILHLGFVDFPKYFIAIQFVGLETVEHRYHIKDIHFYFKTYNPSFTQMEMSFRFIYATATFLVTCWFMYSLRKYHVSDWAIEQKWMGILLPLLFLYNNPTFPLMFLINSSFPGMVDAFFQVTFLSGLFLFWLSIYHGLRQIERRFLTFYLPKLILIGSLWLSAIILASWQKMNSAHDPTYSYMLDTTKVNNLKNFFIVCGVTYLLYLVYLVFKAYSDLRSMPYFDLRLKFLTGLMLIVLKVSMLVTYYRFGYLDIIEDVFVADLSTKYSSSAEFMSFYGLLNFYVFTMCFVYSPASVTLTNGTLNGLTKDDPSFSMVNDSDEEVHYGSDDDDDDEKQSLNNNRSCRTTPAPTQHIDDESD